ncbi:heat shock 70 kDa protein 12A-like [Mya arenaria]|uniref:heat shock 70 kDa protein 12A-like n=1 Tax=Mya arenaria TaxID=6604 RepID=UPI0022DF3A91|nr:heat shock 70 kDa protein 12A-like [Mya arenaria]
MEKFTKRNSGIEMRDIMWILIVPAELGNQEINLMEEAAMQAGLPWDQLATLYAPIASIVHAENMDDEYKKCLNVLGKNIAVVDVKDTVQITVYQRGRNGALREITAVNNLPCGEASFHAAFENLIVEIVGSRVWSKFRQTSDYLDFTREWESLKRTRVSGRFKVMKLPCTLMDLFQECTHSCLSDAIEATKYTDLLKVQAGKLNMDSDFLIQLFQPSLDTLTSNINTVLENKTVSNDAVILLVGDFAECDVVQDTIKQVFSGNRVIVPNECGLSALKGGVLYGHMYE